MTDKRRFVTDAERIEDAIAALDKLADLLADSEDLRVRETPAVRTINEVIELLGGREGGEQ